MPITKSTKKSFRQSERKKAENIVYNKKIKSLLKKAEVLVAQGKKDEAKVLLPEIYKALDKGVKVNVLKKNTAARRKSKMARLVR